MVVVAALVALLVGGGIGAGVAIGTRGGSSSPTGGSPGGVTPTPNPNSPAAAKALALYRQALSATRSAAGFHYVSTSGGPQSQKIVGDAGASAGKQVITVSSSFGSEQFTLLLVSNVVYFQGNAAALEDQLGVPAAGAPALDGKWVSVSPGDGPYSVVAPGITTADQAQEIALVPVSTSQVGSGGTTATRISGTLSGQQGSSRASAHLDIDPTSHLPIEYVTTGTIGGTDVSSTTTFSAWGTAPSVAAPTGAVAWSTLGASEPPGGYGGGGQAGPSPSASASA